MTTQGHYHAQHLEDLCWWIKMNVIKLDDGKPLNAIRLDAGSSAHQRGGENVLLVTNCQNKHDKFAPWLDFYNWKLDITPVTLKMTPRSGWHFVVKGLVIVYLRCKQAVSVTNCLLITMNQYHLVIITKWSLTFTISELGRSDLILRQEVNLK